jgi:Ser/Thr protein kinase RdoA (MazF antagonist)
VFAPVPLPAPEFATLQDYAAQFTCVETWEPYVQAICDRHGLSGRIVAADLAGTNPVFIIAPHNQAPRCVVKLYETRLFDGTRSCAMERAVYGLIAQHPHLPAPALLAHGDLFGDGRWPYNVIRHIPGHSLSQASDQLGPTDRLNLAAFLGRHLRALHSLPTPPTLIQAREPFREFLHAQYAACEQRLRDWGAVSPHLLGTLHFYLFDEAAWDTALLEPTLRLIHADLNADHVLGQRDPNTGAWTPTGLIDFGDARVADRLYELVPLHLGLFGSDTTLLRAFMAAYGPDDDLQRDFVRRAMNFTLLFQFNALGWLAKARSALSWEALAARIWDYA